MQCRQRAMRTPRPAKKDWTGECILKYFARATAYMGLHFESYDDFIFTPVIKKEILQAKPMAGNYITVYLSAYSDETVVKYLSQLKGFRFQVFSKQVKSTVCNGNVTFIPVNHSLFIESMIGSAGVIIGAGFETPAEALHLQKKLMVIPIRGQYEQLCNAAALAPLGVTVLNTIDASFTARFYNWIEGNTQKIMSYNNIAPELVNRLLQHYPYKNAAMDIRYPDLIFN